MANLNNQLGKALGLGDDNTGFVEKFKTAIKNAQGDGVSTNTRRAMLEAGLDVSTGVSAGEVKEGVELVHRSTSKQGVTEYSRDATIVMPNGSRVTPLQYQKLQQMLLKHKL